MQGAVAVVGEQDRSRQLRALATQGIVTLEQAGGRIEGLEFAFRNIAARLVDLIDHHVAVVAGIDAGDDLRLDLAGAAGQQQQKRSYQKRAALDPSKHLSASSSAPPSRGTPYEILPPCRPPSRWRG